MRIFSLLFLLVMGPVWAIEEVVIVQAVSREKDTFAVRRGLKDGVNYGQASLFSNQSSTFTAIAVEVTRYFSVWEIKDKRGGVPFRKGDYISYTNSVTNVWTEIPRLEKSSYDLYFKPQINWLIAANYSLTMSESVAEQAATRNNGRTGGQFSAQFAHWFTNHFEYAVGVRYDYETSRLENPGIDIPTYRLLGIAEIYYHFNRFQRGQSNLYVGTGFAVGASRTDVDRQTQSGIAWVFPILKFGNQIKIRDKYAMRFEIAFDAIYARERFEQTSVQTTNTTNVKLGLGFLF